MYTKIKGPLFIASTAILWSFGGLLIKLIPWSAMTIVGMRSLFAAAVMAIYMRQPRIKLTPAVILGGLSLSGTTVLFVFANKLTTAANAIVLQYTAPIYVLIISILLLRKRTRTLDIAAVIIVFAGIALFFFDQLKADAALGNLLACASGITFAGVFLINRMPGANPEQSLLLGHVINFFTSIPFIITGLTWELVPWISILILGIFQLGLAYVFFSIGIKQTAPLTASLIAGIEPILNPIWVMLAVGEKPGALALIGGVIVIVTITIYNIVSAKKEKVEKNLKEDTCVRKIGSDTSL